MAVDMKTINRARMVERLAKVAVERAITAEQVATDMVARAALANAGRATEYPSDTVWAMLVIRLGGEL